ncbi:unnamed protein product [Trichogramma brassicae]|uniref:Uncharacterized protein n=1 Tax=Trichogramma brassicae TaxID=86971 RepID=A0A6H5IRQ9_9HYME|nr:unnamed protein product [Trichogramma brassicae]
MPECGRDSYLFTVSWKRASVDAAGFASRQCASETSHTMPKRGGERADDAPHPLFVNAWRPKQQDKRQAFPYGWERYFHIAKWPRDAFSHSYAGGGTISEWVSGLSYALQDMRISKHSRLDGYHASYATDRSRQKLVESTWKCTEISASRDGLGRGFRSTMESRYIRWAENQWRSGDGPWHNFAKLKRGKVNAMRHCGRVCWYHRCMERNTNEEQRRSFARRCQGSNREGLHRQSGRRWTSERGRRALREKTASEGGKSQPRGGG